MGIYFPFATNYYAGNYLMVIKKNLFSPIRELVSINVKNINLSFSQLDTMLKSATI